MNLQTSIRPNLWQAVSSTYQAGNYTHAILDAMHYLSDVLREKAGVEGDGVNLVGQALGGDAPRLKINKLETASEKDEQKGFLHILNGLYMHIRNPRSHEQVQDIQQTADAIIIFINYLLGILEESREPFTIQEFMERVFDSDFVLSERYAQLLVDEIPNRKLLDTSIEIYRNKAAHAGKNLAFMGKALISKLSEPQLATFLSVVSDKLKVTSSTADIRLTLQMLPPEYWQKINEVARLRVENKLLNAIERGQYNQHEDNLSSDSAFGTWALHYLKFFTLKKEARDLFTRKLCSENFDDQNYVVEYFLTKLPLLFETDGQIDSCITYLAVAYGTGNSYVGEKLKAWIDYFPAKWKDNIQERLKDSDGKLLFSFDPTDIDDIPF